MNKSAADNKPRTVTHPRPRPTVDGHIPTARAQFAASGRPSATCLAEKRSRERHVDGARRLAPLPRALAEARARARRRHIAGRRCVAPGQWAGIFRWLGDGYFSASRIRVTCEKFVCDTKANWSVEAGKWHSRVTRGSFVLGSSLFASRRKKKVTRHKH